MATIDHFFDILADRFNLSFKKSQALSAIGTSSIRKAMKNKRDPKKGQMAQGSALAVRDCFSEFVYISYVVKQRYQIKYTNFWLAFFKNPQNFIFGVNYQKNVFECRILLRT